jgi:PAS domain S-box-containing protein
MNFNIRFLPELLQHIAVFFLLTALFKYILLTKFKFHPKYEYVLNGILFALIAGIGMMSGIEISEGRFIDGRIILVGVSAAYIHPIAGVISALLVSIFRLVMGGVGVPIGVIGICGGALVGTLFYIKNKSTPKTYSIPLLLLLGFFLTLQAQIWIPILYPWDITVKLLKSASLVGLISYPIGTTIIGLILNTLIQFNNRSIALKESEIFFSQMFEQSIVSTQLLDPEGNTLRVNPKFCELFGVTPEDMLHYKIFEDEAIKQSDAYEPLLDVFNNKNSHRWHNSFDIALASESSGVKTTKPETVYLENLSYPILDKDGNLLYAVIQHHNITEKVEADKALQESEQLLKSIADNFPNSFLSVINEDYTIGWSGGQEFKNQGINPNDFVGLTLEDVFGENTETIRQYYEKTFAGENQEFELFINEHHQLYRTVALPSNGHRRIVSVVENITERKKAEEALKASLKEKETLLQEVHHRVKNNMQVINSLLKLQSNNIEDAKTKEILKDSQSRVYAMSAVHETLHGSGSLSEIDLQSYLSKITTSIFQTYSTDSRRIELNSDIKNSPIILNQAYPLGLIINELISNSLKYAFPDEREGKINVNLKKQDKELELTIMDDGVGVPDNFDWKNPKSLGLKLVRTLVENQLDGSIDMESNNGTKFTIKFNLKP